MGTFRMTVYNSKVMVNRSLKKLSACYIYELTWWMLVWKIDSTYVIQLREFSFNKFLTCALPVTYSFNSLKSLSWRCFVIRRIITTLSRKTDIVTWCPLLNGLRSSLFAEFLLFQLKLLWKKKEKYTSGCEEWIRPQFFVRPMKI